MVRRCFPILALSLLSLTTNVGFGQLAARSPLGPQFYTESQYRRLGLEEAWMTQVELDAARAVVKSIYLQVIGVDSYESHQETAMLTYEVSYDGKQRYFAENDLGRGGQPIGRAEAQRLAEKLQIQLEARGYKVTVAPREVVPVRLYAFSTRGTLQSIDAENGRTVWATNVGHPAYPNLPPAANDRYVAAVKGSQLYLRETETGEPVWDRELGQNPSLGLAMSHDRVFVPGLNGQVEGYLVPDEQSDHRASPPWIYQSGARITTIPAVTSHTVSWATTRGHMFVANLEGPNMSYRLHMGGPIFGQAAILPPDRLVAASTDGFVSAVNEITGSMQWSVSVGYSVMRTPVVDDTNIYVVNREYELFCLDGDQGAIRWVAPGIDQVLASGEKRIYAFDRYKNLVAIDKESGARIASLPMSGYSQAISNDLTDRIYLISESGTVLCLREIGKRYPHVRIPLPGPPESESSPGAGETPTDEAPVDEGNDVMPPGDDIFGGDVIFDEDGTDNSDDAATDDMFMPDAGDDQPPADDTDDSGEGFVDPFDFG